MTCSAEGCLSPAVAEVGWSFGWGRMLHSVCAAHVAGCTTRGLAVDGEPRCARVLRWFSTTVTNPPTGGPRSNA